MGKPCSTQASSLAGALDTLCEFQSNRPATLSLIKLGVSLALLSRKKTKPHPGSHRQAPEKGMTERIMKNCDPPGGADVVTVSGVVLVASVGEEEKGASEACVDEGAWPGFLTPLWMLLPP